MNRALARTAAATAAALCALVPAAAHAADPAPLREVRLPFLWPEVNLLDVAPVTATNVWLAGSQGGYCVQPIPMTPCSPYSPGNPVVRQWNGSAWKEYPLNGWSGQGKIINVEAHGDEVWVEDGPHDRDYLGRFDGKAFQRVTAPPGAEISRLWSNPAGTWVRMMTERYGVYGYHLRTGSTWTAFTPPMGFVQDIDARTATEAWAVGDASTTGTRRAAVARWNGTSWQTMPAPNDEVLNDVAVGPSAVWAISGTALYRWDGTAWTDVATPGDLELRNLSVDGTGAPVVTAQEHGSVTPTVFRHSGGAWQRITGPAGISLSKAAPVPGGTALWALGFKPGNQYVLTSP